MSLAHVGAVIRHDLRVLRRDPAFLIIMIGMPLVVMAFIKPAFRTALQEAGNPDATGAEHAVPGMAVMFSFFLMGNVGFGIFREHGWNTWDRLRASWATPAEVMAAKVVTPLGCLGLQLLVLFGLGDLIFGLRVKGSYLALVLVAVALAVCLVSLGLLLLSICRTVMQLNAATNLGTMVFAGLGGSITPFSALPGWARSVAPSTPSYWAMRGFRSAILDGGGVSEVLLPAGVLLAFSAGFVVATRLLFRFEETKISWA